MAKDYASEGAYTNPLNNNPEFNNTDIFDMTEGIDVDLDKIDSKPSGEGKIAEVTEVKDEKPSAPEKPAEEVKMTDDDVLVNGLFSHKEHTKPKVEPAKAPSGTFTENDVRKSAAAIEELMSSGRFERAVGISFMIKGEFRRAVRDAVTVSIPLGSRDEDLYQIAAGALIQSYLDNGKLIRRDIEEKLFAIIESSEPEYDEDDEIIRQTYEDTLYKVTACMIFMSQICEGAKNHPAEKEALYGAEDSILDTFLLENLDTVTKYDRFRVLSLRDKVAAFSGEVCDKVLRYIDESSKNTQNFFLRFIGECISFRVTFGIICALFLVTAVLYLMNPSALLSFVATDNVIMLFIIGAEIFFTVALVLLAVLISLPKLPKANTEKGAAK